VEDYPPEFEFFEMESNKVHRNEYGPPGIAGHHKRFELALRDATDRGEQLSVYVYMPGDDQTIRQNAQVTGVAILPVDEDNTIWTVITQICNDEGPEEIQFPIRHVRLIPREGESEAEEIEPFPMNFIFLDMVTNTVGNSSTGPPGTEVQTSDLQRLHGTEVYLYTKYDDGVFAREIVQYKYRVGWQHALVTLPDSPFDQMVPRQALRLIVDQAAPQAASHVVNHDRHSPATRPNGSKQRESADGCDIKTIEQGIL
jgi:hypothetical protein